MLLEFTIAEWLLAGVGAFCIGFSKSGFMGVGLVTVVLMARLFPPRESTGVLLPLLIAGDVFSVLAFHRHAQWQHVWRVMPPTVFGVVIGFFLMAWISPGAFGAIIGWIVLAMVALQILRQTKSGLQSQLPHTTLFAWTIGVWSGVATMLANAAGPIIAIYFLAIQLPKYVFVGTSAWFFLLINIFKVPFSAQLGLIDQRTLVFDLLLLPIIACGIFAGRALVGIVPQRLFEQLMLLFVAVAALRLIRLF